MSSATTPFHRREVEASRAGVFARAITAASGPAVQVAFLPHKPSPEEDGDEEPSRGVRGHPRARCAVPLGSCSSGSCFEKLPFLKPESPWPFPFLLDNIPFLVRSCLGSPTAGR